ncbi:MAG: DUF2278 family protein [Pseudomonadota bacterium]
MTLRYGFVKSTLASDPVMKASRRPHETQYHLHFQLDVAEDTWDVAVNVGTNDADDLLKYKLVYNFSHPVTATLAAAANGATELTGQDQLPALDFMRSNLLDNTGAWRDSDVMDGSEDPQPVAGLKRLLLRARQAQATVYVFGRYYNTGNGIHDAHMNQGSTGSFLHEAGNDDNDHNDIWQDGAVLVDFGGGDWVAYVSAFNQQLVPTDDLGNPKPGARTI